MRCKERQGKTRQDETMEDKVHFGMYLSSLRCSALHWCSAQVAGRYYAMSLSQRHMNRARYHWKMICWTLAARKLT